MTRHLRVLPVALAAGALAACGTASGSGAGGMQDVELPGFVSAAARPIPTTLCDPDPARPDTPPPALPDGLTAPTAVFYESAQTTLEAYAWTPENVEDPEDPEDPDPAKTVIEAAVDAAAACD